MGKDERGYIVVETITSFLLLVLLMLSILSLVNIVAVQARVHYALTQAAEAVSMYSYTLEVTGAAKHIQNNAAQAETVQGEINSAVSNINQVLDGIKSLSVSQIKDGGEKMGVQVKGWVDSTAQDPKRTIQLLLNYGLNQAGNAAFSQLMRPLVGHYLSNGELSGDEYLRRFQVQDGIDGLSFSTGPLSPVRGSTLMDSKGNLRIYVTYKVDYSFGALPLPFEPEMEITQSVVTKAWLSGRGEGYKP